MTYDLVSLIYLKTSLFALPAFQSSLNSFLKRFYYTMRCVTGPVQERRFCSYGRGMSYTETMSPFCNHCDRSRFLFISIALYIFMILDCFLLELALWKIMFTYDLNGYLISLQQFQGSALSSQIVENGSCFRDSESSQTKEMVRKSQHLEKKESNIILNACAWGIKPRWLIACVCCKTNDPS